MLLNYHTTQYLDLTLHVLLEYLSTILVVQLELHILNVIYICIKFGSKVESNYFDQKGNDKKIRERTEFLN